MVDRSGSMQGTSIAEARNALQLALRSLRPGSFFNILGFGSRFKALFAQSRPYDDTTLAEATKHVEGLEADLGGTEILPALKHVFDAERRPGVPRQVFVLTDGEVSNTDAVIALARQHAGDTRVFTFGIGAGASHHLVEGLARAGEGAAEFIAPGERIEGKVHAAALPRAGAGLHRGQRRLGRPGRRPGPARGAARLRRRARPPLRAGREAGNGDGHAAGHRARRAGRLLAAVRSGVGRGGDARRDALGPPDDPRPRRGPQPAASPPGLAAGARTGPQGRGRSRRRSCGSAPRGASLPATRPSWRSRSAKPRPRARRSFERCRWPSREAGMELASGLSSVHRTTRWRAC